MSWLSVLPEDPQFAKGAEVRSLSGPRMEISTGGKRPTKARVAQLVTYVEVGAGAEVACDETWTGSGTIWRIP